VGRQRVDSEWRGQVTSSRLHCYKCRWHRRLHWLAPPASHTAAAAAEGSLTNDAHVFRAKCDPAMCSTDVLTTVDAEAS